MSLPFVSIIIIGHNEEKRLAQSIESALHSFYPTHKKEIIYVDCNSTDRSLQIAKKYPIKIVSTKNETLPPGAARNVGARISQGEVLHFLDGDMILERDWILKAIKAFRNDQQIACVFGKLQEMDPEKNVFNKLLNLHFALQPAGEYPSPAGGGTYRREAFDQAGGFDENLHSGEEIDMGYRLRRLGYRIVCLDTCMALHDADFHGFKHFWNRAFRDGKAETLILRRCRNLKEILSRDYILKTDAQLFLATGFTIASIAFKAFQILPVLIFLPVTLILRKSIQYNKHISNWKLSVLSAFFLYFNKLPMFLGHIYQTLSKR